MFYGFLTLKKNTHPNIPPSHHRTDNCKPTPHHTTPSPHASTPPTHPRKPLFSTSSKTAHPPLVLMRTLHPSKRQRQPHPPSTLPLPQLPLTRHSPIPPNLQLQLHLPFPTKHRLPTSPLALDCLPTPTRTPNPLVEIRSTDRSPPCKSKEFVPVPLASSVSKRGWKGIGLLFSGLSFFRVGVGSNGWGWGGGVQMEGKGMGKGESWRERGVED